MEHGLKYIRVYVQKHIYSTSLNVLYSTISSQQAARSADICETRLLHPDQFRNYTVHIVMAVIGVVRNGGHQKREIW